MSWVIPRVWAVFEEATSAKLNEISASLNDLDRRTTVVMFGVAALESTSSATFTDLVTVGPTVVANIGSTNKALVALHCRQFSATAGQVSILGVAISGATTLAASDQLGLTFVSPTANGDVRHGTTIPYSTLNQGSTTFTDKFRSTSGSASWETRLLAVTPLGS